eukprot:1956912-Alexandrium_andersonii.AAC.1
MPCAPNLRQISGRAVVLKPHGAMKSRVPVFRGLALDKPNAAQPIEPGYSTFSHTAGFKQKIIE